MNKIKFADNVTMESLNPHNFALKNDYINNLVYTALAIIPYANEYIGADKVRVTRGFLSRKYMQDEIRIPPKKVDDLYKHAEGLAIELTWDNFDTESAIGLARFILNPVTRFKDQVKIVINGNKKRISFYLNVNETEVYEDTTDGLRQIM